MLNHISLLGRLTRDPELRRTQTGVAVANFAIACDRDRNADGERQTDFIEIVAWRNTAEFVSKYLKKGSLVAISGRLQMRRYTANDGTNRTQAEVVADSVYFGKSKREQVPVTSSEFSELDEDDGNLPF